ncbi:hypothetical protein [Psychromarinibacter sp. S121]|uniref:hypothetical protein n=1 Tax=Psychromarinibacter sp. S121 TaxID=3415127 RepID=UPI003C7974ED
MLAGFLAVMLSATASETKADEFQMAMQLFLESDLRPWIDDPVLIDAIRAQNTRSAELTPSDIDALDADWRAAVDAGGSDLIDGVLNGAPADFLRAQVEASGGAISEAFVMDNRGLNVAASAATSDYWQGDEDKFQMTFDIGPDAVHISDIEFDASSETYQGQISITIVDPDTGAPIGAITIGVDAQHLL